MESSEDICYQFDWGDNNCLIFFWTMRHSYILLQSSTWSFTIYLMIFYLNRLKLLITVSHFRQSLFMYYKWFFLLPWGGGVMEIQNKQSCIRRRECFEQDIIRLISCWVQVKEVWGWLGEGWDQIKTGWEQAGKRWYTFETPWKESLCTLK